MADPIDLFAGLVGQAAATADLTGRLLPVPGWLTDPVCFFLICHRHWFNRVPGANLGIACLPSALILTLEAAIP